MLIATPPDTIAGRMEVRGLGILPCPHVADIPVSLLVRLDETPERMPFDAATRRIAGIDVREVALDGRTPSAPIKVELALRHLAGEIAR